MTSLNYLDPSLAPRRQRRRRPNVGTQRMGHFLRNRRVRRGCPDWIAVRRCNAHRREARTPSGGGRGRICDTDDRSFLRGIAFVSSSARPMASEIGRASCRERVEIAGEGGGLEKKNVKIEGE